MKISHVYRHLVAELLRDSEGGSVDQAFSRRRALRRRVKRAEERREYQDHETGGQVAVQSPEP
jgi:hypothetical protein